MVAAGRHDAYAEAYVLAARYRTHPGITPPAGLPMWAGTGQKSSIRAR